MERLLRFVSFGQLYERRRVSSPSAIALSYSAASPIGNIAVR